MNGRPFSEVRCHEDRLEAPGRWRRPRRVFACSMSDLFHADVPEAFIGRVLDVMRDHPQHTFQVLTKRAERLARVALRLMWPAHVWAGVSVEEPAHAWRVEYLRRVPAAVRFLSVEPLLAPLAVDLTGVQWVVAGGESGARARPAALEWFRDLRDQCVAAGVPFFLKQLGGHPHKRGGADAVLDGERWRQWPMAHEARQRAAF